MGKGQERKGREPDELVVIHHLPTEKERRKGELRRKRKRKLFAKERGRRKRKTS